MARSHEALLQAKRDYRAERRPKPIFCTRCWAELRKPSPDTLCGFCREEKVLGEVEEGGNGRDATLAKTQAVDLVATPPSSTSPQLGPAEVGVVGVGKGRRASSRTVGGAIDSVPGDVA